jgi:hypothetical protein
LWLDKVVDNLVQRKPGSGYVKDTPLPWSLALAIFILSLLRPLVPTGRRSRQFFALSAVRLLRRSAHPAGFILRVKKYVYCDTCQGCQKHSHIYATAVDKTWPNPNVCFSCWNRSPRPVTVRSVGFRISEMRSRRGIFSSPANLSNGLHNARPGGFRGRDPAGFSLASALV